jgi:hypothetical protein
MPKGHTHPPELAVEARRLRRQHWQYKEIAAKLGVARSTVCRWCLDPNGEQKRRRVDSYQGKCTSCGGPTNGSNGPAHAPTICAECLEWPEDTIIAAMREWAEDHGGRPPTCADWRYGTADHPNGHTNVIARTGWNNLLLKAGFEINCDRRPETQAEMELMLTQGWSTQDIADYFGWTPSNVHARMAYRGKRVSELRQVA